MKRSLCLLPLAMAISWLVSCACKEPVITSMTPSSGPGGTIVDVTYSSGAISGVIVFDGSTVDTRSASSLGLGNRLRFTVPYNASSGNKDVQVRSDGQTSAAMPFNVTGTGTVPTPVIDGFEIGADDGRDITVFGTGFSTMSKVFVDGVEAVSYLATSTPFRTIPIDLVDNLIICQPQTPLALGSAHNVQVRNPNNTNSNTLSITVPDRVCTIEFDAIVGYDPPDYYVERNNRVNTIRRSYVECGWLIELIHDDFEVVDPGAGAQFSNADMYSFWQANADHRPGSDPYMHGSFLSDDTDGNLGIMFLWPGGPTHATSERREGFAVFWDNFSGTNQTQQNLLRTTIHEAGHGFNLVHADGASSQTVMNTTGSLANNWHMQFSTTSCDHLQNHTLNAVVPGGEAWGTGRSCNSQH